MTVLFESRWQATKVRWLTRAFAVWAVGWVYWAWDTLEHYGLTPGDGGVLRPLPERAQMAAIIAVAGVLPLVGMMYYSRLYLTRIERAGDTVLLTTLGVLKPVTYRYDASDLSAGARHEGVTNLRTKVHAPWMALRAPGRRVPFVVDLQAEIADVEALEELRLPQQRSA